MTIYALSSGPGISGVAVIRISGKETSKVLELVTKKKLPKARVATIKKIIDPNNSELIDEGIVLWFPSPQSYTGEDMAELHVHGSKAVIDRIHKVLKDTKKCRIAEPGEFSYRSYQNGKIDLLKAEAVSTLIASQTEEAAGFSTTNISGEISKKNIRSHLPGCFRVFLGGVFCHLGFSR